MDLSAASEAIPKSTCLEVEAFNTGQGAGYVLDFSDRTFAAYFDEEFGIDIDHEPVIAEMEAQKARDLERSLRLRMATPLPASCVLFGTTGRRSSHAVAAKTHQI